MEDAEAEFTIVRGMQTPPAIAKPDQEPVRQPSVSPFTDKPDLHFMSITDANNAVVCPAVSYRPASKETHASGMTGDGDDGMKKGIGSPRMVDASVV